MTRYAPLELPFKKHHVPEWKKEQKSLDHSFPIILNDEWFKNDWGSVRWNLIRTGYEDGIITRADVVRLYKEWRDTSEYLMLDGYNDNKDHVMSVFVKASKRGNDVYKKSVKKKFKFMDCLPPITFFNDDIGVNKTPMIFVSLTIDPKKYDIDQAYVEISKNLNVFETLLRQKYGKFVKFRVWESHKSGYPHSHIAYYFHDTEFPVFGHYSKKDGKKKFRIPTKDRDSIASMWKMGHIDIQGIQDTLGAFSEVKKYITKNIWNAKSDLTNAMLTLYNKQAFWVSQCNPFRPIMRDEKFIYEGDRRKDFVGSIWGVDAYVDQYMDSGSGIGEPRVDDLVETTMSNYNKDKTEKIKWEFVGMILGLDLKNFVPKFKNEVVYEVVQPSVDLYAMVNLVGI